MLQVLDASLGFEISTFRSRVVEGGARDSPDLITPASRFPLSAISAYQEICAIARARNSFMGHLPVRWAGRGRCHETLCKAEAAGMAYP